MNNYYAPQREAEAEETHLYPRHPVLIPEQDLADYRHHPDWSFPVLDLPAPVGMPDTWTAPAFGAGDHADVEVNP